MSLQQASVWKQWELGVGVNPSPMVKHHLFDADLVIVSSLEICLHNGAWQVFLLSILLLL